MAGHGRGLVVDDWNRAFQEATPGNQQRHTQRFEERSKPGLISPYRWFDHWYRLQAHCHSDYKNDDGENSRLDVVTAYAKSGYDAICISSHNQVTPDPHGPIRTIPGFEDGYACRHHLVCLGSTEIPPQDTCPCGNVVPRIDFVTTHQGIAIVAHPHSSHDTTIFLGIHFDCGSGWSIEDLRRSSGFDLEIFNATVGSATDWWDELLSSGHAPHGYVGDDCENVKRNRNFNRCWLMVNSSAASLDLAGVDPLDDLMQNLRAGNFYSVVRSPRRTPVLFGDAVDTHYRGPHFHLSLWRHSIRVTVDENALVRFVTGKSDDYTARFEWPVLIRPSEPAIFDLSGHEDWARVEIDTVHDGEVYTAYSQPLLRAAG